MPGSVGHFMSLFQESSFTIWVVRLQLSDLSWLMLCGGGRALQKEVSSSETHVLPPGTGATAESAQGFPGWVASQQSSDG